MGVDHESVAIDAYQHMTGRMVKPTGIWMFHNNIIGASPDGLVFADQHSASAVGILEVKCPYSLRDTEIGCDSEWQHHLHYLDCNKELKKTHEYYHHIQGAIAAEGVQWCDFVIWTSRSEDRAHLYRLSLVDAICPPPRRFFYRYLVASSTPNGRAGSRTLRMRVVQTMHWSRSRTLPGISPECSTQLDQLGYSSVIS